MRDIGTDIPPWSGYLDDPGRHCQSQTMWSQYRPEMVAQTGTGQNTGGFGFATSQTGMPMAAHTLVPTVSNNSSNNYPHPSRLGYSMSSRFPEWTMTAPATETTEMTTTPMGRDLGSLVGQTMDDEQVDLFLNSLPPARGIQTSHTVQPSDPNPFTSPWTTTRRQPHTAATRNPWGLQGPAFLANRSLASFGLSRNGEHERPSTGAQPSDENIRLILEHCQELKGKPQTTVQNGDQPKRPRTDTPTTDADVCQPLTQTNSSILLTAIPAAAATTSVTAGAGATSVANGVSTSPTAATTATTSITPASTRASSSSDQIVAVHSVAVPTTTPGFPRGVTGYEFELNHHGNLLELDRQCGWARKQLSSCNENNRFHTTQTTAAILAVNGGIVSNYTPRSLCRYGTDSESPGLRVTVTTSEGNRGPYMADNGPPKTAYDAALILRFQLVTRRPAPGSRSSRIPNNDSSSDSSSPPQAQTGRRRGFGNDGTGTGNRNGNGNGNGVTFGPNRPSSQCHRYPFAITTIPLRRGVPCRPGYRPISADDAKARLRAWGGKPDLGVFGDAWLINMVVAPGHAQHTIDRAMVDKLRSEVPCTVATQAEVIMEKVHEHMQQLVQRESALSLMLSNHATQKRIARQCPDLVAMWVLAQENL